MRKDVRGRSPGARPPGWAMRLAALTLVAAAIPAMALAQGGVADTVSLAWSAPGDDGQLGTATAYELRISFLPIDETTWSAATVVAGTPVPQPAGTPQRMVVGGLTPGTTYYFAIKTVDESGNWSLLSNVVRWDGVYDSAPPSAPTGVTAVAQLDGMVRVSWTPNSEADLAGYSIYRAIGARGPFFALNGTPVTSPEYRDGAIPAGTDTVHYQITARDGTGNESARSATCTLSLMAQASAWTMDTGYPNPSGPGATVRIPLVVPGSGGDAHVDIVNDVGQRVRRIDLGTPPPGPTEVPWDGRNDAGREVAPGVYTAWLIAGSERVNVRLVRVP